MKYLPKTAVASVIIATTALITTVQAKVDFVERSIQQRASEDSSTRSSLGYKYKNLSAPRNAMKFTDAVYLKKKEEEG